MAVKEFFDAQTGGTPETVTDQRVKCSTAVTYNSTTYYEGWLYGLPTEALLGTDATYGAWTATSKGGTQYTVIFGGYPGNNECLIELQSGRVLTNSSTTLYFRYLDCARVFKWWELGGEKRFLISGLMNNISDYEFISKEITFRPERFIACQIISNIAGAGNLSIRLKNDTTGDYQDALLTAAATAETTTFSTPIELQTGDELSVTVLANNSGVYDPHVIFYRG